MLFYSTANFTAVQSTAAVSKGTCNLSLTSPKLYRNKLLLYSYWDVSCNPDSIRDLFSRIIRSSTVRSVPKRRRFGVRGGLSEPRRLLPDMVCRAESTQAPEVVMGQMRSLHCEGQSFSSWEQSNTGIKSHIFRVMWPLTADTPPCARAL